MTPSRRKTALAGTAIALAAAGLFASATVVLPAAAADNTKVKCIGVNACKGKSDCASENNRCAGQNACKGQGWVTLTEKDCRTHGGVSQRLP